MSLKRSPYRNPDAEALSDRLTQRLAVQPMPDVLSDQTYSQVSAVLFLLSQSEATGRHGEATGRHQKAIDHRLDGIHLVLNKRSPAVRQGGDLCCPGGGVTPFLDRLLGAFLRLPGSPLTDWPLWVPWRSQHPTWARRMALLFGTALREGFEEMGLNPLKFRFLGPLPVERLIVFRKEIYPFVGWVNGQRRFRLNWEVEGLVYLSLEELLNPDNYACLRYRFNTRGTRLPRGTGGETPCFLHRPRPDSGCEVLWGATFRITMAFLRLAFDFHPPAMERLPVVERDLDADYARGKA
jgi:hypothetical protein